MPSSAVYTGVESFRDNNELTEVTFADGVRKIGLVAFNGCSSLAAITIPDSVTTIYGYAFMECSSLAAITIPDSVTSIGNGAFWGCSSLTRLSLSPAVSIGQNCFTACTALISAAADQNMSTVEDLLHSRWHRILERVTVLCCLKTPWNDDLENQPDGDKVVALQGILARKMLPKVMWRVILEFL
jgi:hypothetical protein